MESEVQPDSFRSGGRGHSSWQQTVGGTVYAAMQSSLGLGPRPLLGAYGAPAPLCAPSLSALAFPEGRPNHVPRCWSRAPGRVGHSYQRAVRPSHVRSQLPARGPPCKQEAKDAGRSASSFLHSSTTQSPAGTPQLTQYSHGLQKLA